MSKSRGMDKQSEVYSYSEKLFIYKEALSTDICYNIMNLGNITCNSTYIKCPGQANAYKKKVDQLLPGVEGGLLKGTAFFLW